MNFDKLVLSASRLCSRSTASCRVQTYLLRRRWCGLRHVRHFTSTIPTDLEGLLKEEMLNDYIEDIESDEITQEFRDEQAQEAVSDDIFRDINIAEGFNLDLQYELDRDLYKSKKHAISNRVERYRKPPPAPSTAGVSIPRTDRAATFKLMMKAGCHYGASEGTYNPYMGQYLIGIRHGQCIFDLTKTVANLRRVVRLLQDIVKEQGVILFVGNSPVAKNIVGHLAEKCKEAYSEEPWLKGGLTNWNKIAINARQEKLYDADGSWEEPLADLQKIMVFRRLPRLPDIVVLLNREGNDQLVHEAKVLRIPVVCLCDSDTHANDIMYVLPGNDDSPQSVYFFMEMMSRGIRDAKRALLKHRGIDFDDDTTEREKPEVDVRDMSEEEQPKQKRTEFWSERTPRVEHQKLLKAQKIDENNPKEALLQLCTLLEDRGFDLAEFEEPEERAQWRLKQLRSEYPILADQIFEALVPERQTPEDGFHRGRICEWDTETSLAYIEPEDSTGISGLAVTSLSELSDDVVLRVGESVKFHIKEEELKNGVPYSSNVVNVKRNLEEKKWELQVSERLMEIIG